MSDWSRMGGQVHPGIHARFLRVLTSVPAEPVSQEAACRRRPPLFKAKLSPERVRNLRALRREGVTLEVLARRFHVAVSTASRAAAGKTW